ncbi:MAG: hypothetical protein MI922_27145, partial [Bacteroidales bacterium]|nr:hypothetical protein [Bacteroidales bacterium]
GAGFHSVLQSSKVQLTGQGLEKVKNDPAMKNLQNSIVSEIKGNSNYMKKRVTYNRNKSIQLGGQRAKEEMWKQALEIWKWADEHSATWKVAFNELTWLLRSITVHCKGIGDTDGKITIAYQFSDVFDLRPNWQSRSMEYNAACAVLGYIYHDVVGGNDELRIHASWSVEIAN